MSYINQIVVDSTTYDIGAKNLVNGFTQTEAGVNALDAAAGKTLNDNKAPKQGAELTFKVGTNDSFDSYPVAVVRSTGDASSGRALSVRYETSSSSRVNHDILDKNGNFLPDVFNRYSGICTTSFVVSGGGTTTINVEANARFLIILTGRYNTHQGLIVGGTNGSGQAAIKTIEAASSITVDTSTAYKLKFTNSHATNTSDVIIIMYGATKTANT